MRERRGRARNTVLPLAGKTDDGIRPQRALMRAYSALVSGLGFGLRPWSLAKIPVPPHVRDARRIPTRRS
jgi:hypothetical protein